MFKLLHKQSNFFFRSSQYFQRKKDLYEILGVSSSSTQNEIKIAYYKLAQQYHPDKNPSELAKQKFNEIQGAYDTLGDKSKRNVYDSTGGNQENLYQDMQGRYKDSHSDRFRGGQSKEEFYADYESFFDQKTASKKKGKDIHLNIDIDFKEVYQGSERIINYQKQSTCSECNGTKLKKGAIPVNCNSCKGQGFIKVRQGAISFKNECGKCKGTGKIIKQQCFKCRGKGLLKQNQKMEIKIPQGIEDGQILRYANEGNMNENSQVTGDLIVTIKVNPHDIFIRQDSDLISTQYISHSQAVLGDTINVQTMEGEEQIQFQAGIQENEEYKIKGKGFQDINEGIKGDQIVKFKFRPYYKQELADEELNKLFQQLKDLDQPIDNFSHYYKNQKNSNSQTQNSEEQENTEDSFLNKLKFWNKNQKQQHQQQKQ